MGAIRSGRWGIEMAQASERPIILHQMSAFGASPLDLIALAADNGCEAISLFAFDGASVLPPSNSGLTYPAPITPDMKAEVQAALVRHDMRIDGIEFFPVTADVDLEHYRPALALGRELGARRAVSHIFILDDALAVDRMGALCDLAAAEGLALTAEFCPLTPGNPSLERARWLVDQIGRDNFGIGLDMLHVVRSGASAADLAALPARYFGIVQICDAHGTEPSNDYFADVHNRLVPGTGDLPLVDLLNAIPANLPIEVEVPAAHRRAAGASAAQHVRDVIDGARTVIGRLKPVR
jgi:sugar phosphate isomerase/epimerase